MTPQQLRNSILQMAIEGKLTRQLPEDGNAADLLKKIKAEKAKLIKEKKIKKEKPLPEIGDDEIPFEIPDNWCWVRLGDIVLKDMGGGTPAKDNPKFWNGTIPWMSVKDFSSANNGVVNDTLDHITAEGLEGSSTNLIDTSAVVLCVRMGLGRYAKLSKPTAINQDLRAFWLSKNIEEKYFLKFYSSINIKGTGTTVKGIKRIELLKLCFPMPPLREQKRIVARLEEILPLVDAYEKAYNELQKLNKKFPVNLKNSLLQMAIEGKLVEQRPEDGNAADLLKKIKAEKARLIKEKKIKKEKPLPEIRDDEIPFEVPENWVWTRLGTISSYAQPKVKIKPNDINGSTWSLDLEDIEKNTGHIVSKVYASERDIKGEKVIFSAGNILYSKLRPYLKKILIATDDGVTTSELVPFYVYGTEYQRYFMWYLRSPYVDITINSLCYGIKMPRVGTDTMCKLVIPLPPLAEQKRIVAKLEQLLPLCDEMMKHG
ncbi:restriction endonuclease subunit S [Anaerovibrio slackiae]|uniref:restriction endonuclease subunit S n=1 Tax=Anaerovibrio slackiae TaxID=2652309 RepID=UPI003F164B72